MLERIVYLEAFLLGEGPPLQRHPAASLNTEVLPRRRKLGVVLGLTGASAGALLVFILPCFIYLRVGMPPERKCRDTIIVTILMFFAAVVGAMGTVEIIVSEWFT